MNIKELLQNKNVRIGAIAGSGVLILLVMYTVVMGGPKTDMIGETTNKQIASYWNWRIAKAPFKGASPEIRQEGAKFELWVTSDNPEALKDQLAQVNGTTWDKPKMKACAAASMFNTTSKDTYFECQAVRKAYNQIVLSPGVVDAEVTVSLAGDDIVDETGATLTATVYMDPFMESAPDGESMAKAVRSATKNLALEDITIRDTAGNQLWPMESTGVSGVGGSGEGSACQALSDPGSQNIYTIQVAISKCFEEQIRTQFGGMLGGSEKIEPFVAVTLDPETSTETVNQILAGEMTNVNRTETDGQITETSQNQPGSSTRTSTRPAGSIKSMTVSIAIRDTNYETFQQVRSLIYSAYPERWQTVKVSRIKGKAEPAAKTKVNNTTATPESGSTGAATTGSGMPRALLALIFVVVTGLLAVVAMLYRKNSALGDQRKMFEEEFRTDYNRFQQFASAQPDALARELEELLGARPNERAPQ